MDPAVLVTQAQHSLVLSITVALPVLLVAAVVGVLVAVFQAASQIQDVTIAHLPRLLAVVGILVVAGPWMGHQLVAFAEQMLRMAGQS